MTTPVSKELVDLLVDLHSSLDRFVQDLAQDRPKLATAVRQETAWIPRAEQLTAGQQTIPKSPHGSPEAARAALRPLLYRALDAGVLDARRFDVLMLRRAQAARRLAGAGLR
jgi:hypothetical protein